MTTTEANKALQGTESKDKNELLFSRFDINYNNLPAMFRKGSTIVRESPSLDSAREKGGESGRKDKKVKAFEGTTGEVVVVHQDIIRDEFWSARPWLLR